MAQPHRNSSFSYKTIHPKIKEILTARSNFTNRTQLAMPFVKATTTLNGAALSSRLGFDGTMFGFTLGLHAVDKDAAVQDIYSDANGNALIGYTYTVDDNNRVSTKYIYATSNDDIFLNKSSNLVTDLPSARIPPPGITGVTVGRIRNGVVSSADINFVVPTLQQLEMLHRTFLVPGIGMILEWGQQFSTQPSPEVGEKGLTSSNIDQYMFPWYDRDKLITMVDRLANNQIGIDEIMNCYVHPTEGQYQWIFGRVSNFTTKANGDGSYDCTVKIVGSAEDSWAYAVRNTAIPSTANRDGGAICAAGINSVESYFTKTSESTEPYNFFTVLENMAIVPGEEPPATTRLVPEWEGHVIKLRQGNQSGGEGSTDADASGDTFGDAEDAYYISWRFFVNVILNNEVIGLKSVFAKANLSPEDLKKISILRPYAGTPSEIYIDDPYENFVGNNKFLRSTDPNALIIVNETAANLNEEFLRLNSPNLTGPNKKVEVTATAGGGAVVSVRQTDSVTAQTTETEAFQNKGDFFLSDTAVRTANKEVCPVDNDRGLLSAGVWLNHKMIVQAMASAQTITDGLTNVLNRMNAATSNFWNLTLDVSEPIAETCGGDGSGAPINYTITDMNYRESSDVAVKDFIDNVYVFNKYVRDVDGNRLGSDVTDCTVDMNLPKRLFSQIATLGLSQPAEGNIGNAEHSSIIGDNDALREMFGITQLSNQRTGISADLTSPFRKRAIDNSTCVQPVNSTSVGSGTGATPTSPGENQPPNVSATKRRIDALERYQGLNICITDACADRIAAASRELTQPVDRVLDGDCRSTAIGPGDNQISGIRGLNPRLANSAWAGKNIPLRRTELTLQQAFTILKDMNCSKPLILNVLSVMKAEQWKDGKFKTQNYNFGGFDLTNAAWPFDPAVHDGYVYRKEGGTRSCKTFASFRSAEAGLYVEAEKLIGKDGFQQENPQEFARTYYKKWNGLGARELAPVYADTTRSQRSEFPASTGNPFQSYDQTKLSGWADIFTSVRDEVTRLPGWSQVPNGPTTVAQLRKPVAPTTPATPTPSPTPTPSVVAPVSSRNEQISAAAKASDLITIGVIKIAIPDAPEAPSTCNECVQQKKEIIQLTASLAGREEREAQAARIRRQSPNLSKLFRYLEVFPEQMVANITNTANGVNSNAFGASPGTLSINAELTLPGINGLRVGELFWIDKIPAFYRLFGAFQIINIQDVIGQDGWNTKISAKFNYLGNAWKESALRLLNAS